MQQPNTKHRSQILDKRKAIANYVHYKHTKLNTQNLQRYFKNLLYVIFS